MSSSGRLIWFSAVVVSMAAAMALSSCGVSGDSVGQAQARIDTLSMRGAPDSVLSDARLLIAEVKGAQRSGAAGAGQKIAELNKELDRVQAWYQKALESAKADLATARKALDAQKTKLSGLCAKAADSMLVPVDSLAKVGFTLQARARLAKLEAYMSTLLDEEQKGAALRKDVVGTWREVATPDGVGSTSVQTTTYTFGTDGALTTDEKKKGQSNETTKEDWQFNSWGKWEMKGDTVVMHITREKCSKQAVDVLVAKDGKTSWQHKDFPTYDSTITDDHKMRAMALKDLKTFKKGK